MMVINGCLSFSYGAYLPDSLELLEFLSGNYVYRALSATTGNYELLKQNCEFVCDLSSRSYKKRLLF